MSRRDVIALRHHRADFVRDAARAALEVLADLDDATDEELAAVVGEAIHHLRRGEAELMWAEVGS